MRYVSLAFTGYRTEKLPFTPDEKNLRALSDKISSVIREESALGIKYYMSGVCRGSDLIAADAVLKLRKELGIELWCVIPFADHRNTIPYGELELYDRVLSQADGVKLLYKGAASSSDAGRLYNERNRYMIAHCDGLIAVCPENDIIPGGTKNTVEFAKRAGKKIIYIL